MRCNLCTSMEVCVLWHESPEDFHIKHYQTWGRYLILNSDYTVNVWNKMSLSLEFVRLRLHGIVHKIHSKVCL